MSDSTLISAIIIGKNEENCLKNCLKSISLICDEIIYIDLNSNDESLNIAKAFTNKLYVEDNVNVVEEIHPKYSKIAKNNLLLLCDPDEVVDVSLQLEIQALICTMNIDNIFEIRVPMQNYFKNYPLKGTIWGGPNHNARFLINRKNTKFLPLVHNGRHRIKGEIITIKRKNNNVIHHYWVKSISHLFEKHNRYLKKEGENMYQNGQKYTFKKKY